MKPPTCQWHECRREMRLIGEGEDFWYWGCGCGCTRAVSKPSARNRSLREKAEREMEELKQQQRAVSSRPLYSFPSNIGRR